MGALSAVIRLGRSMNVLLAGILLFHAGWYLLLPFIAVLFTSRRGLTPAEAGLLLATQSFTLLAGSLLGGWLADRLGRRVTIVAGLLLRGGGLWALGLVGGLPALLAAMATAGLGGGIYGPAAKAGIAAIATEENRTVAFAARGVAANIGVSLGPLLGAILLGGPMGLLFGVAGVLHLGLAAVTWALFREERGEVGEAKGDWWAVLSDRPYLAFSLVTVLAWALFAQLAISVPLYAREVLGLESSIGLLWTATSLTVILCQLAVTRFSTRRLHPMSAMALGAALLGAGLGLVSLARSFPGLLLAVLVFIFGEMLLMPTADSAVSSFARKGALGSYFGIATVAWGLGEGVGSLVGGGLMQYALATRAVWVPWALYAVAGLAVAGLFLVLGRAFRRTDTVAPAEAARIQLFRSGQPAPVEERAHLGPPPDRSEREGPGILLKQEPGPGARQEEE
ncbi:MAG: MFS transporter [Bacillota bacterium]